MDKKIQWAITLIGFGAILIGYVHANFPSKYAFDLMADDLRIIKEYVMKDNE